MINKADPLPYYAQLARILRSEIASGRLTGGDLLPSESDLCSRYGLSRTAVRQALDELVAEGLVEKSKGKGTFVTPPKRAAFVVQEVRGFHDEMSSSGFAVDSQILRQERVGVEPEVAKALGMKPSGKAVIIERVRGIDGLSLLYCSTFLPLPRFAGIEDEDLDNKSLYSLLESTYGVSPRGGHRQIEAEAANRQLSDLLGVDVGTPMLKMTAVNHDQNGTPFEFFRAWYRGDHTVFVAPAARIDTAPAARIDTAPAARIDTAPAHRDLADADL